MAFISSRIFLDHELMKPRGYRERCEGGDSADLAASMAICPLLAYFRDFIVRLYDYLRLSPQP
jgi:hypothetical protein